MSDLENFDIKSHVIESIVEVFDTMVSMEIVPSDSEPEATKGVSRVVASVNFAGNIAGILNIQVTAELARLMTANMLDMEPEELEGDGEMKDLLSEISNIVSGNLKSALNDAGLTCVLSTPSMTYGGDFTIQSLNMERFERLVFMHQQDGIIVEVGIKTQQGAEEGGGLSATDAMGQLKDVDIEKVNAIDIKAQVAGQQGKDIHYSVNENSPEEQVTSAPEEVEPETAADKVESDSSTVSQSEIDAALAAANAPEAQEPPGSPPPAPQADQAPPEPPSSPPPASQADQSSPETPGSKSPEDVDLDLLLDIPLEIKVELGRAKIQIQELLNLAPGSAVKLIKLEGEPVDILANETLIARGEVVVQKEKYGIRVTEITSRLDRIRSFGL